jgi:hypothetical protein
MALKDCVRERAQGAAHVSYRKSKLTQLLRSCFTMEGSIPPPVDQRRPYSVALHIQLPCDSRVCRRSASEGRTERRTYTVVIATVSPSSGDTEHTLGTRPGPPGPIKWH